MKKICQRLFPIAILLVIATLPLNRVANNIGIAFLILSWLLGGRWEIRQIGRNLPALAGFLFMIVSSIGVLYSQNIGEGTKTLESIAPFLIFPVILTGLKDLPARFLERIPKFFVWSVSGATLLALLIALMRTMSQGLYYTYPENGVVMNNFVYHRLTSGIGIHAGFLSLFVCFSILIIINDLITQHKPLKSKWLNFFLLIYLTAIVVILKSAMVALSLSMCLIIYSIFLPEGVIGPRWRNYLKLIIPLIAFISLLSVSIKVDLNTRLFRYDFSWMPPNDNWNAVNLRLALWDASAEAIIDHQPLGVGTGDGVDVLMQYYKRANFEFALYNKYHSHNQYLFTLLCLGIPGLAILLLLFGLSFYASIHQKNLLYIMLILLMFFFCFTDIPMVRNKTVVFFMFFLHFFQYTYLAKKDENVK